MHRPCSKRRASTMHDTPGSPDSRIPAEGIRTVLISDCAVTVPELLALAAQRLENAEAVP